MDFKKFHLFKYKAKEWQLITYNNSAMYLSNTESVFKNIKFNPINNMIAGTSLYTRGVHYEEIMNFNDISQLIPDNIKFNIL